jgi:hypothetical protein
VGKSINRPFRAEIIKKRMKNSSGSTYSFARIVMKQFLSNTQYNKNKNKIQKTITDSRSSPSKFKVGTILSSGIGFHDGKLFLQ